jgi:acyl carrier protein
MNSDATLSRLIEVIRREFASADTAIDASSTAADVDGWDSVSHTMLVLALEDEFGCKLDFGKTLDAATVGELAAYVDRARQAKP